MTMRPFPPSVDTVVTAAPIPAGITADAHVYIVGVGNQAGTSPSAYSNSRDELLGLVPADGYMHEVISDLMASVSPRVALTTVAAGATLTVIRDALRAQIDRLDPRPTHIMVPYYTGEGNVIGAVGADALTDVATTVDLAVAPIIGVTGKFLLIEDEIVRVTNVSGTTLTIERGLLGTDAASHDTSEDFTDFSNIICVEMEAQAARLGCRAIADAPETQNPNVAIVWAESGNTSANVMGINNWADGHPPCGAWLGAALRVAAENGRQRGIELAPVASAAALEQNLVYHPRESADSDVSRLVNAYLSNLVRSDGQLVIVGDTFRGVEDARRIWSVAVVVDHAVRISDHAQDDYIGRRTSEPNIGRLAFHVEEALGDLVRAGEVESVTTVPHPINNTPAQRGRGRAHVATTLGVYIPLEQSINYITI